MRLWIAPCFRSRRAVSNGGHLLSVAYDLTCVVTSCGFYACMHACMHACMDACMDGCMDAWMYACIRPCKDAWTHRYVFPQTSCRLRGSRGLVKAA